MVGEMGFVKATDKIVLAGHRQSVELEVEVAATMYPGRVVKGGTTNNEMVVGAADALSMGWLSYEDTPVMYRPATIDTIYAAADRAAYVFGPGMIVVASLLYEQEIVMGDKLVPAAAGQLQKWTPVPINAASAEEDVIAIAMETVTSATNATDETADDIIVRSLI
jgi:hypothetical protein